MDMIANIFIELIKTYKDEIDISIVIWVFICIFIIVAYFFLKRNRIDTIASHGQITTNIIHQLQSHANTLQNELDSVRPYLIELNERLESAYSINRETHEELLDIKNQILELNKKYNEVISNNNELLFEIELCYNLIKEWENYFEMNNFVGKDKPPIKLEDNINLVRFKNKREKQ